MIVSGSYDKTVKIWDLKSRSFSPIQTLSEAKDSVTSIFVSPTEIIAASVDGCIRAYDIRAGRLRTDHLARKFFFFNIITKKKKEKNYSS